MELRQYVEHRIPGPRGWPKLHPQPVRMDGCLLTAPVKRACQGLCKHRTEERIRLCGVCEKAHHLSSPVRPWDTVAMGLGDLGWFKAWSWFDEWRARPELSSLTNPVNYLQQ